MSYITNQKRLYIAIIYIFITLFRYSIIITAILSPYRLNIIWKYSINIYTDEAGSLSRLQLTSVHNQ